MRLSTVVTARATIIAIIAPALLLSSRPTSADEEYPVQTLVPELHHDDGIPQPVVAWSSGPLESRVAFDRPLDPAITQSLVDREIEGGPYVRRGARSEVTRPGSASVHGQMSSPRTKLRIAAARLADHGRTLVLATDPHGAQGTYGLTLPDVHSPDHPNTKANVDVAYDLTGLQVAWVGADGQQMSSWLPHLDSAVSSSWTADSEEHAILWELQCRRGNAHYRGRVSFPSGQITFRVEADCPFQMHFDERTLDAKALAGKSTQHAVDIDVQSSGEPHRIQVSAETGMKNTAPRFETSYHTQHDPTERPLQPEQFLVPWAPPSTHLESDPAGRAISPLELGGADPVRGEAIFFGKQARCSECHRVRGHGGTTGPDLSKYSQRNAGSVLRDIVDPNASIDPGYLSYRVIMNDGRMLSGVLKAIDAQRVLLVDATPRQIEFRRSDIVAIEPLSTSLMPAGFADLLGQSALRDLVAFLMSQPAERHGTSAVLDNGKTRLHR